MNDTITATTAHTSRAERGQIEGGGSNPLLRMDTGLVIWTWVIFVALLLILKKFAWRPVMKMLDEREWRIKNSFDDIEKAKKRLADAEIAASKILAEAEEKGIDIINRSRESAQTLAMDINRKALEDSERIIEVGRSMINSESEKATILLRREAASMAITAAERIIRERLDSQKDRELTEAYINEIVSRK